MSVDNDGEIYPLWTMVLKHDSKGRSDAILPSRRVLPVSRPLAGRGGGARIHSFDTMFFEKVKIPPITS